MYKSYFATKEKVFQTHIRNLQTFVFNKNLTLRRFDFYNMFKKTDCASVLALSTGYVKPLTKLV